jgi:hypothetical protein
MFLLFSASPAVTTVKSMSPIPGDVGFKLFLLFFLFLVENIKGAMLLAIPPHRWIGLG